MWQSSGLHFCAGEARLLDGSDSIEPFPPFLPSENVSLIVNSRKIGRDLCELNGLIVCVFICVPNLVRGELPERELFINQGSYASNRGSIFNFRDD